ncbi:MAG: acyl-CoA thioesterase domain-containing protein [Tissierellales bacterium]
MTNTDTQPKDSKAIDSQDIPSLLLMDGIGEDCYRNRYNKANTHKNLFGGQLVAQALAAADATVEGQAVHSLHGYFYRSGSVEELVEYQVERVRDGKRISNRRVTARQRDRLLFAMSCSYRSSLDGFEHQRPLTIAFEPETAIDLGDIARSEREDVLPFIRQFALHNRIDVRIADEVGFLTRGELPRRHYWVRVPSSKAIKDESIHRQIFAYLSDLFLPGVPLVPHTTPLPGPHLTVASLDHAIWFHRPIRCDDWLLFDTHSPNARGSVNLTQGYAYDRSGQLVASVAQEALQVLA